MAISPAEQKLRDGFQDTYSNGQSPVLLSIDQAVCGCNYGSTSWMTRAEVDLLPPLLGLKPGVRLLDVGAGAGWPGLYLAKNSGCDITLVDIPMSGLQIAAEHAVDDCLDGTCWTVAASGTELPFPADSFDSISHSDVLCCLVDKQNFLEACRNVIRSHGRMVFSVIYVAPGLSGADYDVAVSNAPTFVETGIDYPTMLRQSGWHILDCQDLSENMADTCARQLQADEEHGDELKAVIGEIDYEERVQGWRLELGAIRDGLIRRALYVTDPVCERP